MIRIKESVARIPGLLAVGTFLVVIVLAGVGHYWFRELKFDDAWIHYRYAENIGRGMGFVYNDGERVLGSGGPLWNLLLAGIALALPANQLHLGASALNFVLFAGCGLVVSAALTRIVPFWLALVLSSLLLLSGPLLVSSLGGMETSLLCLMYLLTFRGLVHQSYVLAGFWAGIASCIRIESVALMLVVLAATLLYRRALTVKTLLSSASAPLLLYCWVWLYFGSPLATSTLAKQLVYSVPPLSALKVCVSALLSVLPFEKVFPLREQLPEIGQWIGALIWVGLVGLGTLFLRRRSAAGSLVVLHLGIVVLFYMFTNPYMFPWYSCTFVPLATLLAMLGIVQLGQFLPRASGALRYGLSLAILLSFSIGPIRETWTPLAPPDSNDFSYQVPNARGSARTYQYMHIANWLNQFTTPNDQVCISEIGAFGYYFQGKILDGIGLVSPEVFPYHPLPASMNGAIPPRVVEDFKPEFVVSMDIFAEALFVDPWFRENYRLIGRWPWFGGPVRWRDLPDALWGSVEMRAYRRRDIRWEMPAVEIGEAAHSDQNQVRPVAGNGASFRMSRRSRHEEEKTDTGYGSSGVAGEPVCSGAGARSC